MEQIDKDILNIIHTHRDGSPVGFQTIDRVLLMAHEDFILSASLGKKLDELEQTGLIQSPDNQIGYSMTQKGIKELN